MIDDAGSDGSSPSVANDDHPAASGAGSAGGLNDDAVRTSDDSAVAVLSEDQFIQASECAWKTLSVQPDAGDPRWGGADPATNTLEFNDCNGPTSYRVTPAAPGPAPAAPPAPPDPAVLAAQAIAELKVPEPSVGTSPDPDWLAVNFWTWLYTDDPGPVSTTVELRGVSVTATASLSQVAWVMGEPVSLKNAGAGIAGVTCNGPGVAPPANPRYDQPPPCGYMYKLRSTKERTAGTERWPVTATATWAVTWTSNTGVSGTDQLQSTSSTALVRVGEYRTVGGFGSGG